MLEEGAESPEAGEWNGSLCVATDPSAERLTDTGALICLKSSHFNW